MRLTSPFNLPAPGTRQPLYVVLLTLQRPVFLLNSRLTRFAVTHIAMGTPYPEVTELICLVPEQSITRAPEYIQLVDLCRFVVRVPRFSLEDFPGRRTGGFTYPVLASSGIETIAHPDLRAASPHWVLIEQRQSRNINRSVHRLRLSASP